MQPEYHMPIFIEHTFVIQETPVNPPAAAAQVRKKAIPKAWTADHVQDAFFNKASSNHTQDARNAFCPMPIQNVNQSFHNAERNARGRE